MILQKQLKNFLSERLKSYHEPIVEIINKTDEIIRTDIYNLKVPLQSFTSKRTILVGDACHPT